MDPERLRALVQRVLELREQGVSTREMNRHLRRADNIPFNSVNVLEQEAQLAEVLGPQGLAGGLPQQAEAEDSVMDNVQQALAPLIQGATGSLASDAISGLEQVGVAREGASGRFREDLSQARQEHPFISTGTQIAGLLAGPAGKAGNLLLKGGGRVGGLLGKRAGSAIARKAGAGELGQILGGAAGQGAGGTIGGAAAGAAEGAAIQFGERAGVPADERARGLLTSPGTMLGAGVGGLLGGGSQALQSVRGLRDARKARGEVLADAGERVGRELPSGRQVRGRVSEAEQRMRQAFQKAEEAGRDIPGEVTDLFTSGHPQVSQALRNAARQGSPEARRFVRELEAFRAGDRGSPPAVSFELADDVRKQLKFQADAFARRAPDAASPAPSQGAVNEAEQTLSRLEGALSEVPGFDEALSQAASAGTQRRAFQTGRQLFSRSADEVEDVIQNGEAIQSGSKKLQLAGGPQSREAARAGLAQSVLQRLRGGSAKAETFLKELESSSELQRKMEVILGGGDELESFMQEASRLQDVGRADEIADLMVRAAGFLGFGTSLFGGVLGVGAAG